jgi:hypothetical protein
MASTAVINSTTTQNRTVDAAAGTSVTTATAVALRVALFMT